MIPGEGLVDKWLKLKGWKEPNITQRKALDAGLIDSNKNFVIVAPTASGKTGVAELAMLQTLNAGMRVIYLVPLKALIAEKERDFESLSKIYKISGAKASIKDWEAADIVITTFELFYKTALTARHYVENFSLAIIDEFHVLYDKLRGFNLEKALTILKEFDTRIICLSATFEDKNEIGEWLNATVVEVPETAREVQIVHGIVDLTGVSPTKQNEELCKSLIAKSQNPYLLFCTTKESTKIRGLEMCKLLPENPDKETKFIEEFKQKLDRKQLTDLEQHLCHCLSKRVAFHHSGLNQRVKDLVEKLFLDREVDYLFATTGLAYGINFPAKTVVLCDLSFYDPSVPGSRIDVPVYMYIQMAGRAGRPGLEKEGYAYIVTKRVIERQYKTPTYIKGDIGKAISHIGHDEYFRKAILELIYSGRRTDKEIFNFFERTFYNFQSERVKKPFVVSNLFDIIKGHVTYLYNNGFIVPLGAPGYKLTDLGQVTLAFLFGAFSSYELTPFIELNKYLEKEGAVEFDFGLIYILSSLFDGARLSKIPRETSSRTEEFYERLGITDLGSSEYSAFAVFYGWMENIDESEIETDFKVYASQLPQIGRELFRLLNVYESLARKKNFTIPPQFKIFKERARYGVREEELPFVKLRGIGRVTVRELSKYCKNVLKRPPHNYRGTLLDVLKALYKNLGEDRFLNIHINYVPEVGKGRAKKILDFIKKSP